MVLLLPSKQTTRVRFSLPALLTDSMPLHNASINAASSQCGKLHNPVDSVCCAVIDFPLYFNGKRIDC